MAVYYADSINQNNAERATGVAVKNVTFDMVGDIGLVNGDIITLGTLPRQSISTDLKVIVGTEFDGTTPQFIVGQYNRQTGVFVDMADPIVLTSSGKAVFRASLTSADFPNLNPDGSAYTGEAECVINDDNTAIAIKWTGGVTSPTAGDCALVFHHDYFGTNNAKYGLDNVPLTVYER